MKAPNRSAINRIFNKSETTGSVSDNRNGVVGKEKSARTPDNILCVE
jgi:hypothetical protein